MLFASGLHWKLIERMNLSSSGDISLSGHSSRAFTSSCQSDLDSNSAYSNIPKEPRVDKPFKVNHADLHWHLTINRSTDLFRFETTDSADFELLRAKWKREFCFHTNHRVIVHLVLEVGGISRYQIQEGFDFGFTPGLKKL